MHNFLLTIYIWLLTCAPGNHLYEHYGHTAIRVLDTERQLDLCFNYGTFSFNSDHFYWRFVKGETYYMLTYQSTDAFLYEYIIHRRPVYEQELNLNDQQKQQMLHALLKGSQPQNREYLYNFVEDNCSTRPYYLIRQITGDTITSSYYGNEGNTYRRFIERYTLKGTLINSIINMIFGRRADLKMHGEQRLFLPEELMFFLQGATFSDGTPVVKENNIAPFSLRQPHWWEMTTPYLALFTLLMVLLNIHDRKRQRCTWAVDTLLTIVYVIILSIVVFLTFFSIHPLVGFNWRLLVIPLIHLCTRLIYILR